MAGRSFQLRLVGPIALTSLLLLGLCAFVASYFYREQTTSADVLGENIGSRQAASDLEQSLNDLVALHRNGIRHVEPLHGEIEKHLEQIRAFADKEEERHLVEGLAASYRHYLRVLSDQPDDTEAPRGQAPALAVLTGEVLPACKRLRQYNAEQIAESEQAHRRTVRHLAWGLVGVGASGSLAGLLLGYGVARGLRRSIHQLRIRIQDAADKLGRDLPAVVLDDEGDLDQLHEQMHGVVGQIEQVVQKLREREHEVLRAEQLAAVGQLAAGVAHEIRNPLTSIKMLVQTSREDAQAGGLAGEDLEVIESEIRRMERTLKTFLEFARPPKPLRALVDLTPLAERTLNLVRGRAARQHVALELHAPAGPVLTEADGEQFQQVLVNLCLNALDALPHGGRVEVTLSRENEQVELSVCDNGPGIAAELLPRLFEPFVSGKETGLGLGLVVSRRIAEDHGGTLEAGNRPGGGACFRCRLPSSSGQWAVGSGQ